MDALLDTTVIVHLLRRKQGAIDWLKTESIVGITSITWMEIMGGTSSKANQAYSKETLEKFQIAHLTTADQEWAMQELEKYQFSHHIGMNDCLIASVAHRLNITLYTHNIKDMSPMIGSLAKKPY